MVSVCRNTALNSHSQSASYTKLAHAVPPPAAERKTLKGRLHFQHVSTDLIQTH